MGGGKTYHILGDFWAGACIVVYCGVTTIFIIFYHFTCGAMWCFLVSLPILPQFMKQILLHQIFQKFSKNVWCEVVKVVSAPILPQMCCHHNCGGKWCMLFKHHILAYFSKGASDVMCSGQGRLCF